MVLNEKVPWLEVEKCGAFEKVRIEMVSLHRVLLARILLRGACGATSLLSVSLVVSCVTGGVSVRDVPGWSWLFFGEMCVESGEVLFLVL